MSNIKPKFFYFGLATVLFLFISVVFISFISVIAGDSSTAYLPVVICNDCEDAAATATPTPDDNCPDEFFMDVQPDPANSSYPDPSLSITCNTNSGNIVIEANGIINFEYVSVSPFDMVEQSYTWRIPMEPSIASSPEYIENGSGTIGIAINGIPIFGPNESAYLDYGDPFLDGVLDFCNGHTGPGDKYHFHARPECLLDDWNIVGTIVGYGFDGYPILTPFECANAACSEIVELTSSYQKTSDATAAWDAHEYVAGSGDLDECNGKTLDDGSYAYFATSSFPYMMGCIIGEQLNNPG